MNGATGPRQVVGQADATRIPRFAGPATFARLPRLDEVAHADVAVVGVPFDAGTSFRPGARFGPAHIRDSSRLLRPYNPAQDIEPFDCQQVADAGDLAVNPFSIDEAIDQMELLGHDFFVFLNCDTEELNVVYRRRAGDYGIIESQVA